MIAFIALLVIMLLILAFRVYRTIQYYREAQNNADAQERRVARTNFIIHLIFCILLSLMVSSIIFWFVLASNGEV